MPSDPNEPRPTRLTRLMPWTRIGRAPGLALDSRKLLIAATGLGALWAGWAAIDRVSGIDSRYALARVAPSTLLEAPVVPSSPWGIFDVAIVEPFRILVSPFVEVFQTGQTIGGFTRSVLMAVWAVVVWGIAGGAIARIAAVQISLGERMGIVSALRFALRRSKALIGAPLSPMIGIGFFAALCAPFGLLYYIPGSIGATIAGILLILPLLAGLVMALLVAGLAVGWPLMTATVAVEGEDAFDALSRSYSYVSQRPGRYAGYAAVAWVVGGLGLIVVRLLTLLTIHMTQWGLDFGGPDAQIASFFAGDATSAALPVAIHRGWIFAARLLSHGWVYSYFFTVVTIIYSLLRHDVDGTPYHDIGGVSADNEPFAGPDATVEPAPSNSAPDA